MAKVDIIVLNYNGRHFLRPCLSALRQQTFRDFSVVLVDNASTDGSVDLVKAEFPEVRVLRLPENYGFCGGNNRGIKAATGDYVALLNNDTEVVPEWLECLVAPLERHSEVGLCASRMICISDRATIDTAGDVFYTHGVGGKRGQGELSQHYEEPARVFGACAGAALYRRSMLNEIGLLDEDFFAYHEDLDLSFRAQLRGYQCQFVPDAVVYHHVGGSFGDSLSNGSIQRSRTNMLEVLLKNMPTPLLLKYLPRIVTYYVAGDIYNSLRGFGRAVLRARWDNLRRLPRTLSKRRHIQKNRTISLKDLEVNFTSYGWGLFGRRNAVAPESRFRGPCLT